MNIKPHLQYLSYVIRHKWFVLVAGLRLGVPLWRLIIHDWSKFTPAEWPQYVRAFYGGRKIDSIPGEFDEAWNHHQKANPHHWEYWLLYISKDPGQLFPIPMPHTYVLEMVADWMGACRAINGHWDIHEWWIKNRDRMVLNDKTRTDVTAIMLRVACMNW